MGQEKYGAIIKALGELGLTDLEAAVYCALVESSPVTPYRVASDIGKPVANTYKAVESLHRKGLVLIDETGNKQCQAVPPDEALSMIRRSFQLNHKNAEAALSVLKPVETAEKLYSLVTADQALDRCRTMIEKARSIVLADAYPGVLGSVAPWLESAAKRGLTVVAEVYEPVRMPGVETVLFREAGEMFRRWKGEWLIVVADGAEYVVAFFDGEIKEIRNGIWCTNAFLAIPQHYMLAHTIRSQLIEHLILSGASDQKIKRELKRTAKWTTSGEGGYKKLAAAFDGGRMSG